MLAQSLKCPECGSKKVWKAGLRYKASEEVQRYLCRDCGFRFSDPEFSRNNAKNDLNVLTQSKDCQICVTQTTETKNLIAVKTKEKTAGETGKSKTTNNLKGELVNYAWWMKKNGYAKTTIRLNTTILRLLTERGAQLFNSDSIKEVIAKQEWSNSRKHSAIATYTLFLKTHGQTWEPPRCKVSRKLPYIPTEKEIDSLIAGCGQKLGTFLLLLKETAMRKGEAFRLLWKDIDFERRTITLNDPEKGSRSRIFKASNKLIARINTLPRKNKRVFSSNSTQKTSFYDSRKRIARKLQNPRLQQISFHTLRHWKATMLYHQTKDILYVKEYLGHNKVETTLLYIQLAETIFKNLNDEFTVKVASAKEEIKALLEVGFEYICEKDDLYYFRKRKLL